MDFESDAFISYAHLDNVEMVEGQKGWVTNLHRALEVRVGQLLGKPPHIWRDPKLQGNDHFAETLVDRLKRVAVLVTVVSPRYVKSEWALRELAAFALAAESQGGVRFENKARIFKVLKTPVPLDRHPAELQPVLGYEFFKIDDTGRTRELNEIFGPEAQRDFWLKLDDLAHDLCDLLEVLERPETMLTGKVAPPGVFLAETTRDLREQRETLRRDLQQHGYAVYPTRPLSCVESEVRAAVSEDLARCQLAVLLVGRHYSFVPEGGVDSLLEIQNQMTMDREKAGDFSRLLWIPPGQKVEDERQVKMIEQLRMDPAMTKGADLLETFLEELRTVIYEKLKRPVAETAPAAATASSVAASPVAASSVAASTAPATGAATAADAEDEDGAVEAEAVGQHRSLYVLYDQRDASAVAPWIDHLYDHFEVLQSMFEGEEAEIREYHDENLRNCDGVLIFFGAANELWVRRKLREIQKAPGYGRTKPAPRVGIVLAPPHTAEKERFRTHEAMVMSQMDGLSAGPLEQFIAGLER
jgi:hypothetical protein